MDLSNRPVGHPQPTHQAAAPSHVQGRVSKQNPKLFKVLSVVLLASAAVVVAALIGSLVFGKGSAEKSHVDSSKVQAVFLNGGQVYFGKVTELNDRYLRLVNIFYLRVNQQVQPRQGEAAQNNISLVKLGCELHRPVDEMVLSHDQVIFWENLRDEDGENTVPGAIKAYYKANPNGQQCNAPAANGGSNTNTNTNR